MLWWFDGPAGAHVSANVGVDFLAAQAWLDSLPSPRPTVNALVAAAISRTLREFPEANARIIGGRIVPQERVGIAMPVNLIGHAGEHRSELSMICVANADLRSVREIDTELRGQVKKERSGEPGNVFIKTMFRLAEGLRNLPFFGCSAVCIMRCSARGLLRTCTNSYPQPPR